MWFMRYELDSIFLIKEINFQVQRPKNSTQDKNSDSYVIKFVI